MRYCIPTEDERGLEAVVSGHLGSAPWYAILDEASGHVIMISNRDHHRRGSCDPASRVREVGAGAVVCEGLDQSALASLEAAGITAYRSERTTVRAILAAVREGALSPIRIDTACAGAGDSTYWQG